MKTRLLLSNVEHPECSFFKREDHWTFVHGDILEVPHCDNRESMELEGPASSNDASITYPCNLKHCWRCCLCTFCQLARKLKCDDYKNHILYNVRKCKIQEMSQCQDHWIDHPGNFNIKEDIHIQLNILFHNNELKKDGRNCRFKTVIYAELKIICKKCRKNTKEQLSDHLTPHMQCKHCIYEMKTIQETSFWDRVCRVFGRILDNETAKVEHQRKHDVEVPHCEVCDDKCPFIYTCLSNMISSRERMFHREQQTNHLCALYVQNLSNTNEI
jgi:hypothetical protein